MKKLLSSILILTLSLCSFKLEISALESGNEVSSEQILSDMGTGISIESKNKQDKSNDIEEIKNSSSSENDKRTIMEKTVDEMKENLKKHNEQVKNEIQKIKNMSGLTFKLYLIKFHFSTISSILDAVFICGLLGYHFTKAFKAGQKEFLNRSKGDSVGDRFALLTIVNNFIQNLGEVLTAIRLGKIKNFDSVKKFYYNANNFYEMNI